MLGICGLGGQVPVNIKNCYNTGTITSDSSSGGIYAGYYGNNIGNIYQCFNTGKVYGIGQFVGGITGNTGGAIEQSFNLGAVNGGSYTGGIAGRAGDRIFNCYNRGEVVVSRTNSDAYGIGTGKSIVSCYNTGTLLAIRKSYGIHNSEKIYNSFYLSGCGATDNKAPSLDSNGMKNLSNTLNKAFTISEDGEVTVKEDGSMQTVTLPNGETTNVWKADINNINDGYPILSWQEK